ncbi:hypothetical protein L2E82_39741 [Cichorium intybus]|uniref:Uncharacterized protein n=1 Tax=Cichorium intybus TaxID=13427 RepID=A0ACB9AJ49_CICIN|nr:hypothetical protein L2E82_39741 [Cichorium intybus]
MTMAQKKSKESKEKNWRGNNEQAKPYAGEWRAEKQGGEDLLTFFDFLTLTLHLKSGGKKSKKEEGEKGF